MCVGTPRRGQLAFAAALAPPTPQAIDAALAVYKTALERFVAATGASADKGDLVYEFGDGPESVGGGDGASSSERMAASRQP